MCSRYRSACLLGHFAHHCIIVVVVAVVVVVIVLALITLLKTLNFCNIASSTMSCRRDCYAITLTQPYATKWAAGAAATQKVDWRQILVGWSTPYPLDGVIPAWRRH